ncbi:MAG TPA: MmgE/PrpD family protein [Burkholderiales bacterium]|nr:MmgE/PrpD family protein [Burkholderiales bacterium]
MTLLERLGAHAVGGYREGLPGSQREAARLHLADSVGAWIAARATDEGRALLRFESDDRTGLPGRVGLACALARLSEVDDIHLASATTPGAIVVPAALTVAALLDRDGGSLAQAIAVGYDAMARLGAALNGPVILYRGIWPTYLAAPFAVAAVAARLLGLDEKQAAHALAIALAFSSPGVGRQSGAATSRWLAVGQAARNGLAAAVSAHKGFTGDLRLLDGEFFLSVYGISPDRAALADARPALPETSFKPWCAARQTMAAVQALKEWVEEGVPAREISSLAVAVPPPMLKMIDHGVVPGERVSLLTSVAYQLEIAAGVEGFMARVSVTADESLLVHYPRCWPARVSITTQAGTREKLVLHVPGDPQRPFGETQVAEKFRKLAAPVLGERAAENLLRRCLAALDEGPAALVEAIDGARSVG